MPRKWGPTRQRRKRKLSPRLIVACEGEKTEFEYLTRLVQSFAHQGSAALKAIRGRGTDAVGVVKAAMRQRENDRRGQKFYPQDGDKTYALLDVEPHDPPKAGRLEEALRLAHGNDICVLLSNPSFEFWLLCHAAEQGEVCRSFADPRSLDRELRRRSGFGKDDLHAKPDLFNRIFLPNVSHAVEVARHVHQTHHNNIADVRGANACTRVYELVGYLIGSLDAPP